MPIREGYARKVYIVSSGENMAIYAAANIAVAVDNFRQRGYASLGGIILNRRNVPEEREKVEVLAGDVKTKIVADLPRDNAISEAEILGKTVFEVSPDCGYVKEIRNLARKMIEEYDQDGREGL